MERERERENERIGLRQQMLDRFAFLRAGTPPCGGEYTVLWRPLGKPLAFAMWR